MIKLNDNGWKEASSFKVQKFDQFYKSQKKFWFSLNKVLDLMLQNKLREDIDDTLLEKLLTVVKNGMHEHSCYRRKEFVKFVSGKGLTGDLLQCTQLLQLAEKVVLSLKDHKIKLSVSIKVFVLRLMSLLLEKEDIFLILKTSFLQELTNALNSNASNKHPASVQDAILSCLSSLSKHAEGALWLIEQNLIAYIFSCFSCKSYYVRKTAINFFVSALSLWTSPDFPELHDDVMSEATTDIVSQIVDGIQFSPAFLDSNICGCYISTLLELLKARVDITFSTSFFRRVGNYFTELEKSDVIDRNILVLLAGFSASEDKDITVFMEILVDRQLFLHALELSVLFVGYSKGYDPLSSNDLHFILMPLYVLSGNISLDNQDTVFHMTTTEVYSSLSRAMETKATCIKLLTECLFALSNGTRNMSAEALQTVITSMGIAAKETTSGLNHPLSYVCFENRTICITFLKLVSSFFTEKVYTNLKLSSQLMLFEYLLSLLERPSSNSNVLCEVLKVLKCAIAFNAEQKVPLPAELREHVSKLLCRKLLDNKEPVVDNALLLAGEIMTGKENELWKDHILKNSIHMITWEIAIEGSHEGFIKASALKVIIEACLVPYCWEDIKANRGVNEEDVLKLLCNYFHDPDFFIQREAVSCMHTWVQSKQQLLHSQRKAAVLNILSQAVRSLDLELKLSALNFWQWFANLGLSRIESSCDLNADLKSMCDSGLGSSLMVASEDYDEAVKFKALAILDEFQNKLRQLGLSKDSVLFEETGDKNDDPVKGIDVPNVKVISKEERDAGIENVMNLTTTEQITNICRPPDQREKSGFEEADIVTLQSDSLSFSLTEFWVFLWSERLSPSISKASKPPKIFSEYSISLLDDIIAAECIDIGLRKDSMDCY